MKFRTGIDTTLNSSVLDFGNDPCNRKGVAEENVNPTWFKFFVYNSKTMTNFAILFDVKMCGILRSTILYMKVISEKLW